MGSKKNRQVSPEKSPNPAPSDKSSGSGSATSPSSPPVTSRPGVSSIAPWGGSSNHIAMTTPGAPRSALETLAALLVMQEVKGRRSPPSTATVTPEAYDATNNIETGGIKARDSMRPMNNRGRKRSTGTFLLDDSTSAHIVTYLLKIFE
jgi:hypothetical protein